MKPITDLVFIESCGYVEIDRSISKLVHDINQIGIVSYNCCSGLDKDHPKNKRGHRAELYRGYLMLAYDSNLWNYLCRALCNTSIDIECNLQAPFKKHCWGNNITLGISKDTDILMISNWNILYNILIQYNAFNLYEKPIIKVVNNISCCSKVDKSIKNIVNNIIKAGIPVKMAVSGLSTEYKTFPSGTRECGNDAFIITGYSESLWEYIANKLIKSNISADLSLRFEDNQNMIISGNIRFSIPLLSDNDIMNNWQLLEDILCRH